jgi:ketosteroid isomerase-like protein
MEEILKYFTDLSKHIDIGVFRPHTFAQHGNTVIALLEKEFTIKSTGVRIHSLDEIHYWMFDEESGKAMRHFWHTDTRRAALALQGHTEVRLNLPSIAEGIREEGDGTQGTDMVREIYNAYNRQDIQSVLDHLSEDIQWEDIPTDPEVPFLRSFEGRNEVAEFFSMLAREMDMKKFQPTSIFALGSQLVFAVIEAEMVVRRTKVPMDYPGDLIHIWRINEENKCTRLMETINTQRGYLAWMGKFDEQQQRARKLAA